MVTERVIGGLALALGLMIAVPGSVTAQEQTVPPQETIEVTDELLEQFVGVYPEIVDVAQEAQVELAAAETQEQAQTIQQAAQTQISRMLEEAEMTVVEYEAVVTRLNDDPALRAEVEEMLREAETEPGGGTL